jgi:predicted RNase H-like HicB family nuclease
LNQEKDMKNTIQLQNVVYKEGKYYVAQCLNIEVSSFGKTKKEALDNLNEALELYFEDQKPSKLIEIENASIVKRQFQYA